MTALIEHLLLLGVPFSVVLLKLTTSAGTSTSTLPTKEFFSAQPAFTLSTSNSCDHKIEGPLNQQPEKHSFKLEDNRVGISAGFTSPLTKYHISGSTTFRIATTLFSIQDSQLFSFPLTQQRATSESVQQKMSCNLVRFSTPRSTSRINLLSSKHRKSSNRGIVSVFKGLRIVTDFKERF